MLYDRWLQIAHANHARPALLDLAAGRNWTFGELSKLIDSGEALPQPGTGHSVMTPSGGQSTVFPQGLGAGFVISVLHAWRDNQVVCPLEPGQPLPSFVGQPLPEDIVHLKTTSATTDSPKLVAFTANQLMADVDNIMQTMGLRPDWPNLGMISLAHSYGFSNLVLPLLLHGVPLILVGSALPEALRRAAAGHKALTLAGVPALWGKWHEAHAIPANIQLAISAGAPLPLKLEQNVFGTHRLKIHNFYGSSECGGIAYDRTPQPRHDQACAGTALCNVELSMNSGSCLEVRGAAVGKTYWPESNAALSGGVFRTSDLAEVQDGHVFLRGRATDQINVAGRKVLPELIEATLNAHPSVSECVAFGVPSLDSHRGEDIVACLTVKDQVSADVLKNYLMTRLPAWQVPREWWFVDSVMPNHRGKLSRAEWRGRYLSRSKK